MGRLSNWFIVPSILVMYRSHKSPFHLSSSWNKRKLKRKNSPSMWLVVDNTSKSVIIYVTFSRMPLHFLETYQNFINGIALHCHSHCLKKVYCFDSRLGWSLSLSLVLNNEEKYSKMWLNQNFIFSNIDKSLFPRWRIENSLRNIQTLMYKLNLRFEIEIFGDQILWYLCMMARALISL